MATTRAWREVIPAASCLVILLLFALNWSNPSPQQPSARLVPRRDLSIHNTNLTARANDRNDAKPGWSSPLSTYLNTPFNQLDAKGKAIVIGKQMVCTLDEPVDSTNMPQSPYTNTQDLAKTAYGWTYSRVALKGTGGEDFLPNLGLTDAFNDLSISTDLAHWYQVSMLHMFDSIKNDIKCPATQGTYTSLMNPKDGVLVSTISYGPDYQNKQLDLDIPPEKIIPLRRWSDVAFLALQKTIGDLKVGDVKKLEHVSGHNLLNKEMKEKLAMITGSYGANNHPPKWPGYSYPITENQALALLGTPNGKRIAYLLGTHKSQMSVRAIDRVNIFNCPGGGDDPQWCLYFHVVAGPLSG